jgi:TP901 family phage tail tape measure protein
VADDVIGRGVVEARLDTSRIGQDTKELENRIGRSFQQVGQRMTETGRTLTKRVTAPIMAMGAVILRTAGDYQQSMNQVRAVTGATGDDFQALGDLAQDLGRTTQYSAAEAADAMYYLASAGFDTTETMEALPGVLQLAAAANMDLATASDIASNILSAFGLEASELGRINDGLVATFQSTNTNVTQLGEAMSYAAPVAAAMGVDFEDAAAAIGLMGNAGIQGSTAGTSLRMAMTALAQETGPAADLMQKFGINALDAEGKLKPLDEIIRQLEDSGMSASDMMSLFGQRAGPAMLNLVEQGSGALADLSTKLRESGGIAQEVADIQMEGLNGAVARLKSSFEGAAIAIGESGLLDDAALFAEVIAGWFQRLAETNPELLKAATLTAGIAAAVGPASWAIGSLTSAFGKLLTVGLNPYVIAIGLVVTAVGFWVRQKMDAKQRIDELTASLDENTGSITDNTREVALNRLEAEGAVDAARILGISIQDLTDAALGNEDAMGRVQAAIAAAHDELAADYDRGVVENWHEINDAVNTLEGSTGRLTSELEEARDAARRQAETLAESEGTYIDAAHALKSGLTYEMYNLSAAHGEAGKAAEDQQGPVDDLGGAFNDLTGEVEDAITALEAYIDEIRAAEDPVYAVDKALRAVDEAQMSFTDAVKANEDAQKELTEVQNDKKASDEELAEAQAEVERTARDVEAASIDVMARLGDLERAVLDGELSFEAFEDRLAYWVAQGDITKEQAVEIKNRVNDLRDAAENYSGRYNARLTADTSAARESVDALIARLRRAGFTQGQAAWTARLTAQAAAYVPPSRSLPRVEARAAGGPVWPGNTFLVGEQGPELVRFSGHGRVYDATETAKMLAGPNLSALSAPAAMSLPAVTGDGASAPPGMSWSPQYVFNVDPTPQALAEVRHADRVAYMERR